MSVNLKIKNFSESNLLEQTAVRTDMLAGVTTIPVESGSGFAADDPVVIGELGSESAELKMISAATADTLTATATVFAHGRFERVTQLFGNKIVVYRASNVDGSIPADVSFTELEVIDIDADQIETSYTDATGSDAYWYKYAYRNSVRVTTTDIANMTARRGGTTAYYCTVAAIRGEAGLDGNRHITDSIMERARSEAQDLINGKLAGIYVVPFTQPINSLISKITRLLAAGAILSGEYGPMSGISTAQGDKKTADAMDLLTQLDTKKLVLTGATGVDTSTPGSAGGYFGWPNSTTETADPADGGAERGFRMSDRY